MTAEIVSISVPAPTAAYGRHLPRATRFVEDAAQHLRVVADAVDARLTQLSGGEATCAAVGAAIAGAAERLRGAPAALFVLSYAGHGGRVPDKSGDEADGFDEAWALDDAPLTDDALSAMLGAFHADVHVVLISNCCFSAGMSDLPARWADGTRDGVPVLAGARVRLFEPPPVATNRVVIASCSDQQMMVLPDSSRLTMRVLDVVFPLDGPAVGAVRRRQPTDYAAVERQVAGMASVSQTPMVLASDHDKQRLAFVPQPLVPG